MSGRNSCSMLMSPILLCGIFFSVNVWADPAEPFARGQQAYQEGNYQSAIRFYEQAVAEDPKMAAAYNGLGLAHKAIGTAPAEVAWYFKAAVEADPDFAEAHDHLGKQYYDMRHFDKAEAHCLKAVELNPKQLSAKFSLGWIYLLGKNDPQKAIYYFQEVLARSPIPYARFGLGMAYLAANDRAHVLDSITALRASGENTLATQLENMTRGPASPPSQIPPSSLVTIEPVPEKRGSALPAPQGGGSIEGMSRVRMRGKLTPLPPEENSGGETVPVQKPAVPARVPQVYKSQPTYP